MPTLAGDGAHLVETPAVDTPVLDENQVPAGLFLKGVENLVNLAAPIGHLRPQGLEQLGLEAAHGHLALHLVGHQQGLAQPAAGRFGQPLGQSGVVLRRFEIPLGPPAGLAQLLLQGDDRL